MKIKDLNALAGVKLSSIISKTTYFLLQGDPYLVGDSWGESVENILSLEEKKFLNLFSIAFYYQFLDDDSIELDVLEEICNTASIHELHKHYSILYKEFYNLKCFKFSNTSKIKELSIDLELDFTNMNIKFIDYLDIILKKYKDGN